MTDQDILDDIRWNYNELKILAHRLEMLASSFRMVGNDKLHDVMKESCETIVEATNAIEEGHCELQKRLLKQAKENVAETLKELTDKA
jgi:hypothetical protein